VLDELGPTVQLLTPSEATYCVIRSTIPPGVVVPLHSHADRESFFVMSGNLQVLVQREGGFAWVDAGPGEFIDVPPNAKHAFRNLSSEPVEELLTTTPRLGAFFLEAGKPVAPGARPVRPTPADLERFSKVSADYGYWLGSPEENAAIGISLDALV
jgi:quercetin dioxygenase-like cupin family protein